MFEWFKKIYKEKDGTNKFWNIIKLNDEFSLIKEAFKKYLRTEINFKNTCRSDEIMAKIYFPFTKNNKVLASDEKWDNILFLNFNYTDTTRLYFNNHNTSKIIHIHGELENPKNPIIFGYGDEMDDKSQLIEDKNEDEYLKNNKSIKYLQTGNYQELLTFIDADKYEIFTMGHSCGISDRTLLNTLFEHEHCKRIKPFYYKWKDDNDNYNDIVMNIYRNFKDKQLCRKIVEVKDDCETLPQLPKS